MKVSVFGGCHGVDKGLLQGASQNLKSPFIVLVGLLGPRYRLIGGLTPDSLVRTLGLSEGI